MKRKKWLLFFLTITIMFYIVNSIYIGLNLPNCSRTNASAMHVDEIVNLDHMILREKHYGHLYIWFTYLIIDFFGKNYFLTYFVNNTFYLIILIIFSYLIGKYIKDEEVGIITSILVCLYPITFSAYNEFLFEFPLMAFVAMNIYFLLKSKFFEKLNWSLLVALSIVCGIFMKPQFLGYILGPLCFVIIKSINDLYCKKFVRFKNLLIVILLVFIIIYKYFGLEKFIHMSFLVLYTEPTGIPWYSIKNLQFFGIKFWKNQLSLLFIPILFFGLKYFIKQNKKEVKFVMCTVFLIPFLIIFFMPHWKTERYFLPPLLIIAIISSFYIKKLIEKKNGISIFFVIVLIGLIQIYDLIYEKISFNNFLGKKDFFYAKDRMNQMTLSFREMKESAVLTEKVSLCILQDIYTKNNKKKLYYISFFYDGWLFYKIKSYFLFNSDINIDAWPVTFIVKKIIGEKKYLDTPDYIIQECNNNEEPKSSLFNIKDKVKQKGWWSELNNLIIDNNDMIHNHYNSFIDSYCIIGKIQKDEKIKIYIYKKI